MLERLHYSPQALSDLDEIFDFFAIEREDDDSARRDDCLSFFIYDISSARIAGASSSADYARRAGAVVWQRTSRRLVRRGDRSVRHRCCRFGVLVFLRVGCDFRD